MKVCHGVLAKLDALVGIKLDLEELKSASRALEVRVDEALSGNDEAGRATCGGDAPGPRR